MSTTQALKHLPDDTKTRGIVRLEFPTIYTSDDDTPSVAVSATLKWGVQILTYSVPTFSADAARQVAAQLVEAAACVDSETAKR